MSEAYPVARPRIGTSGIGIYPLLPAQLNDFFKDLWSTTLFEAFEYLIYGKPMDNILSIKWFYGLGNYMPYASSTEKCYLVLGNVAMAGALNTHKVETYPAVQEIVETKKIHFGFRNDMGDTNPLHSYSDFGTKYTDYSPYTTIDLYLPFIGFVSMDPAMLYGRKIDLFYRINLITGDAVAILEDVTDPYNTFMFYNQSCNISLDIPVNITAMQSMGALAATALAAAVGMGAMSGSANLSGGFTAGLLSNAVSGNIGSIGQTNRGVVSGGFNSEIGGLSPLNPSMIIRRHNCVETDNTTVGKPSGEVKKLSTCSGYVEIFAVQSQTQFSKYDDEIIQLLKDGVYL